MITMMVVAVILHGFSYDFVLVSGYLYVDRHVREAICPGCTMEEFTVRMGLDAILTAPDFKKEEIEPGVFRNEWGALSKRTGEEHGFPLFRQDPRLLTACPAS